MSFQGPHLPAIDFAGARGAITAAPSRSGSDSGSESTSTRIDLAGEAGPSPPLSLSRFQAAWEVDHFLYPAVCDRLQMESSDGLAGVVRAVLTRAWQDRRILCLTSFGRSEGTSTIALCIARLVAAFDMKVALVDGNFESPRLAQNLGLTFDPGWTDDASSGSLQECAIASLDDQTVVFPLRIAPQTQAAFDVDRQQVAQCLGIWQECFDLVLIDAGAMFRAAHIWFEPPAAPLIHGAFVVRDIRNTCRGQVDDVVHRLQRAGLADVSMIDNFQGAPWDAGNA
jgi:hypothetical protein